MPVRLRGSARDAAASSTACAYFGPRSRYANPFTVGVRSPLGPPLDAAKSVDLFVATLRGPVGHHYATWFARALHGLDLMCTCALDVPCHADVLLHLANRSHDHSSIRNRSLLEGPR
ncbi:DUF4326 domain-containing protein [Streptomyces sp. NPDC004042]|uniref:DUF4326 domain-containing protein n=1 Tax=Streptomyces sp. NPDC004042 TaxID=3154451 RepID=UPI0033A253CC